MKTTTVLLTAMILVLVGAVSAFPQNADSSASLPANADLKQTQDWITAKLISDPNVEGRLELRTHFPNNELEYRTSFGKIQLEKVDFDGCNFHYVVRTEWRQPQVSMNASMNDPGERRELGQPDLKIFTGGAVWKNTVSTTFNLADVESVMIFPPTDGSDFGDFVQLKFETIGSRIDSIATSVAGGSRSIESKSTTIFVRGDSSAVLSDAFRRAIALCRASD